MLGIISFISSILGLILLFTPVFIGPNFLITTLAIILAILGIILGIIQNKKSKTKLATWGLSFGAATIILFLLMLLLTILSFSYGS